jgi:pimeloyl-ACP methyl ester carboxylesterase
MPEISPSLYRAGEGEQLVLVHGFTATWRCWLPLLGELVPRFEVIAPTLHGHEGGPELPPDDEAFSTEGAADHLERHLDELGVGQAHFAGNSLGGALALEMAKRGRAKSVVAISPGGGWRADDRAEAERIIKWFKRTQKLTRANEPYLERVMKRPRLRQISFRDVMTRGHQVPAGEAVIMARSSIRCSVVDNVFVAIDTGNALLTGLETIDCPVLVTWGEKDRILPVDRHAQRFRDEIPNVEFRTNPGIGHTPMWDDPHLIATQIAEWAGRAAGTPVSVNGDKEATWSETEEQTTSKVG